MIRSLYQIIQLRADRIYRRFDSHLRHLGRALSERVLLPVGCLARRACLWFDALSRRFWRVLIDHVLLPGGSIVLRHWPLASCGVALAS